MQDVWWRILKKTLFLKQSPRAITIKSSNFQTLYYFHINKSGGIIPTEIRHYNTVHRSTVQQVYGAQTKQRPLTDGAPTTKLLAQRRFVFRITFTFSSVVHVKHWFSVSICTWMCEVISICILILVWTSSVLVCTQEIKNWRLNTFQNSLSLFFNSSYCGL